jgi:hypothetical protein
VQKIFLSNTFFSSIVEIVEINIPHNRSNMFYRESISLSKHFCGSPHRDP